jgi:hypothetical protein
MPAHQIAHLCQEEANHWATQRGGVAAHRWPCLPPDRGMDIEDGRWEDLVLHWEKEVL